MWQPLWPALSTEELPITHVTNGVHTLTWMAPPMQQLLDRHLPRWRGGLTDPELWKGVEGIPDAELWTVRCQLREALVEYARERSIQDRISRGDSPDYVDAAARVFSPDTLTLGFARRVAMYKRLYLMGRLPDDGLTRLLANHPQPIQLIAAGKGHPQDNDAKETLRNGFRLKEVPGVGSRVVYLEDYDLHMAPRIVAGADLWLNLPRPPLEASGTSGMKVVLNGGLNLSVLDGWWLEAYDGTNGWAIDSPPGDQQMQDEHDARVLLDLLERQIIPLFYDRDADGIPHRWVQKIKASMRTLIPQFAAERMVRAYAEKMYS